MKSDWEFAEGLTYGSQVIQKCDDLSAVVDFLRDGEGVLVAFLSSGQVALVRQNVADIRQGAGDAEAEDEGQLELGSGTGAC